MQSFLGFASYYRNHIKTFSHIPSSIYKLCSKDAVFEINKERRDEYERIKNELTNVPALILPDFELPFKLYMDAAFSQGLGAALHQRQVLDGEPREGLICFISRKLEDSESRHGETQTDCLFLVWDLEKLYYYLEGATHFEVANNIQEYIGNMKIIYKEVKRHTNADGRSRWPLDNVKSNPAYEPEVAANITIHFMEIDRRTNFRFSELEPERDT
ncbi:hypothetical protein O181_023840 [Austropuccinia psidii MF-1]|uniref:Reverse transcriptase/retrotransposon-derived protein RNase H-like domain-containing protein n=1 Tax=Austropuccinia psidii MF-1 TaxID=1389203 RepID=A0A9Q3CJV1_9BASI|nr:hypothetical protein [Austropuccinia psidii MF-1]